MATTSRPATSSTSAEAPFPDGRWVARPSEAQSSQPRPTAARRRGVSAPHSPHADLLSRSLKGRDAHVAGRYGRPPTPPNPQPLLLPLASGTWMAGMPGAGGRVFNVTATDIGGDESDPSVWPAPKGSAPGARETGSSGLMSFRSYSGPHVDMTMVGIGSGAPVGRCDSVGVVNICVQHCAPSRIDIDTAVPTRYVHHRADYVLLSTLWQEFEAGAASGCGSLVVGECLRVGRTIGCQRGTGDGAAYWQRAVDVSKRDAEAAGRRLAGHGRRGVGALDR
jgi:hypothetical protein